MKRGKIKNILTPDLTTQLVNLRNQGKSLSEMSRITGLPISTTRYIGALLLKKGLWKYNDTWKKRQKTLSTQTAKPIVATRKKRETKTTDHIIINFKGVNLQVQKTSNIIITDTVIYVK